MDSLNNPHNTSKPDEQKYFSPELKSPVQLSVTCVNPYTTKYTFTNKIGGCIDVIMVIMFFSFTITFSKGTITRFYGISKIQTLIPIINF